MFNGHQGRGEKKHRFPQPLGLTIDGKNTTGDKINHPLGLDCSASGASSKRAGVITNTSGNRKPNGVSMDGLARVFANGRPGHIRRREVTVGEISVGAKVLFLTTLFPMSACG
jgi:hypothetical protein